MFLNFRGIQYYYSKIGPTSSKLLRLAYFYRWYDQKEFFQEKPYYSHNYTKIIKEFCKIYKISDQLEYCEIYFWIPIDIGKFYINK